MIKEEKPFIIHNSYLPYLEQINHSGKETRGQKLDKQVPTITSKHGFAYVSPALIQYHSETAKSEVRGQRVNQPLFTVDSTPRYALFTPYLSKYFGGVVGSKIDKPLPTVTAIDHNSLTMPFLMRKLFDDTPQKYGLQGIK